jgi:hypothetical protein
MQTLRTPDDRFDDVPDFPYAPRYCEIADGDGSALRVACPITGPMAAIFQREMRGAQGTDHPTVRGAGHFLQEDAGEELAAHIVEFLRR